MRIIKLSIAGWIAAVVVASIPLVLGQEQKTNASSATAAPTVQPKVFVFIQRTDRHAKYSKPEVFNDVVNDIFSYLKDKNVAIAVDEFGVRNKAEGATPIDTIFNIAADAKANSVMYVVVDRPLSKWLKVTVQCFDMNRKMLWQEEVSSGGGLSGEHGFQVSTQKLHAQLEKRVGQEGLPVLISTAASGATK